MSFWPDDIFADDIVPPQLIMQRAGDELISKTSVLKFYIRETKLSDRIVFGFVVKNAKYDLEFNLFEASHRTDQTYPVLISPPKSDIPDYLKRERYIPGKPGISAATLSLSVFGGSAGYTVENKWVCGTPKEFADKLKDVFALDHVKAIVLSLIAPVELMRSAETPDTAVESDASEEEQEEQGSEDQPPEDD